jgi:hypothetical protein
MNVQKNGQSSFDGMKFVKGIFLLIFIALLIFGSTELSDVEITTDIP